MLRDKTASRVKWDHQDREVKTKVSGKAREHRLSSQSICYCCRKPRNTRYARTQGRSGRKGTTRSTWYVLDKLNFSNKIPKYCQTLLHFLSLFLHSQVYRDCLEYQALLDQKDLKELLVRNGLQYSGNNDIINECLDWMVESFVLGLGLGSIIYNCWGLLQKRSDMDFLVLSKAVIKNNIFCSSAGDIGPMGLPGVRGPPGLPGDAGPPG